jgi:hypothetical protein
MTRWLGAALGLLLMPPLPTFTSAEEKSSGWLMVGSFDGAAPLRAWAHLKAFDTAKDCEDFVSIGRDLAEKGKTDKGKPLNPGSMAYSLRKGMEVKCVPADAFYRAQEGSP